MSILLRWLLSIAFILVGALLALWYASNWAVWGKVLISIASGALAGMLKELVTKPKQTWRSIRTGEIVSRPLVQIFFARPQKMRAFTYCVLERLYFRSGSLGQPAIKDCSPEVAAGLLLALQGRSDVKANGALSFANIKSLAGIAVNYDKYRASLIERSSADLPSVGRVSNDASAYVVGDDLRDQAERKLVERIGNSKSERVHIFATTAQLSGSVRYGIGEVIDSIEELNYYICSPLVVSHQSLAGLDAEYDNPAFCINDAQVVMDGGVVARDADRVRRVIKILAAFSSLAEMLRGRRLRLYVFTKRYPGVKIQLLEVGTYTQVQPGPLTYQNNMYRFGLDDTTGDFARDVMADIKKMLDRSLIEEVDSSPQGLDRIRRQAISEMSAHLFVSGMSAASLQKLSPKIIAKAKSEASERIIREIIFGLESMESMVRRPYGVASLSFEGKSVHISVGMIVKRSGCLMLIKKADPFYEGKFSLVAGHAEHGEGPLQALSRECVEELGVTVSSASLVSEPFLSSDRCRHGGESHLWFVFECDIDTDKVSVDRSEISLVEWASLGELDSWRGRLTEGAAGVLQRMGLLA